MRIQVIELETVGLVRSEGIAAARGSVELGFGLERRTENKYVESVSKLAEWKIRSDTRRHSAGCYSTVLRSVDGLTCLESRILFEVLLQQVSTHVDVIQGFYLKSSSNNIAVSVPFRIFDMSPEDPLAPPGANDYS